MIEIDNWVELQELRMWDQTDLRFPRTSGSSTLVRYSFPDLSIKDLIKERRVFFCLQKEEVMIGFRRQ